MTSLGLPALPMQENGTTQNGNIVRAFGILDDIFKHAVVALRSQADPQRLGFHLEAVNEDAIPLLHAIEAVSTIQNRLQEWLRTTTQSFATLILQLEESKATAAGNENADLHFREVVTVTRTGQPGRPRKVVDLAFLEEVMAPGHQMKLTELADAMGIHRNTLRFYLKEYGVDYQYSDLSDEDLDTLVQVFREAKPDSGVRYLIGFLRKNGLRIQKQRIRDSIHRVDPVGSLVRGRAVTRRREYHVPRPNALWHIDGHHKLIRWGIVIHGMLSLIASTNNRSSTVLRMFLKAVRIYGLPWRVRGDYGGENKDVSVFMIMQRGTNRASFMWGSSTHNNRIERIWVEVGGQFGRAWRAFFYRLESLHGLDPRNEAHLWLLHELFLGMINDDCAEFCRDWNSHPISGAGHDKSPQELRTLGMLKHGEYADEYADCDPVELENFYGVHGQTRKRRNENTGARSSSDEGSEEGTSDSNENTLVLEDVEEHIHHDPVPVPKHASPFSAEGDKVFWEALQRVARSGILPVGYGLHRNEWPNQTYPTHAIIPSGRRGTKEIRVSLPCHIWQTRAELWGQALDVLERVIYSGL